MTYTITESEKQRILGLHDLALNADLIRERLLQCKITSDGKVIIYEGNAYSAETGERLPLLEKWTLSDILHTVGDVASGAVDFIIPGSGAIIDTVNAISYVVEAQFQRDQKKKTTLYIMAAVTFAFVILPGALQAAAIPLKRAIKYGGKALNLPIVKQGFKIIGKNVDRILTGIPSLVKRAVESPLGIKLLKEKGSTRIAAGLGKWIDNIKNALNKLTPAVAGAADSAAAKDVKGSTRKLARRKLARTLSKKSAWKLGVFFQTLPKITQGTYVMKKFGFQAGRAYGFKMSKGAKGIIAKTAKSKDFRKVMLVRVAGDKALVRLEVNELEKGTGKILSKYYDAAIREIPINEFITGTIGRPFLWKAKREIVPIFVKRFADFILPDGKDLDYDAMGKMIDLNPDQTALESLAWLRDELMGDEGNTPTQGQTTTQGVNTSVQSFQNALIALGYPLPRFGADGSFGSETQNALQKFQIDTRLEDQNGKMNRLTAQQLAFELKNRNIPNSEQLQKTLTSL